MTIRSRSETMVFKHPFRLKAVGRELPPGAYEVLTDDEMIEGLSFPCYRRVSTMIMVPGEPPYTGSTEMITVTAIDLANAQHNDAVASRD
jgi:hypothetical protein